ncbi:hypothetical protein ADUPG1_013958 [Aduncisulcus paluster]|uniref:CCT domain-containing protein n=1 Tax=Aduncisulcus paluster TaxID=2918883 RepID=A0ABQ5K4Z5_9EUKA|nr:hypothetical protein ADUPG1_013958 [Aduncisulcus paluster]
MSELGLLESKRQLLDNLSKMLQYDPSFGDEVQSVLDKCLGKRTCPRSVDVSVFSNIYFHPRGDGRKSFIFDPSTTPIVRHSFLTKKIGKYDPPSRASLLEEFRIFRRQRRVKKDKIRYKSRKAMADSRKREKGRFVTSKRAKELEYQNNQQHLRDIKEVLEEQATAHALLNQSPPSESEEDIEDKEEEEKQIDFFQPDQTLFVNPTDADKTKELPELPELPIVIQDDHHAPSRPPIVELPDQVESSEDDSHSIQEPLLSESSEGEGLATKFQF